MPIETAESLRESRLRELRPQLAGLPGDRPWMLEIGCGHGHFATAYAQAHPDRFCVAVDILADRLARADRKSRRVGLNNVAWIRAEADDLLAAWPADREISTHIFILFPDPWPKRRHWKHRLIQPEFLDALARIARTATSLCFRTDHAPYFEAADQMLRAHPQWEYPSDAGWPFEEPTVFQQRAEHYQSAVARRR